MKLQKVRAIARRRGINPARMKKAELIKAIQRVEGNNDCFRTAPDACGQITCLWREDCLKSTNQEGEI